MSDEPNINLHELAPLVLEGMREELSQLRRKLYRTPKWRMLKRYRLHERITKVEGDYGLIRHVMYDD